MAAKFLIHFLGDIHQPLHTENLAVGGNSIHVLFDAKPTNLHHVWDTSIPEKLVGGYALPFSLAWSQNLTIEITKGRYQAVADEWLDEMDIMEAEKSALVWAGDSNKLVCTSVLKGGVEAVNGTELNGVYYQVCSQIALQTLWEKSGVR